MRKSALKRQDRNKLRKNRDLRAVATAAGKKMTQPADRSPPACNFPEILARDLEMSEAVFQAKSLSAGTPIRSLATPASKAGSRKPPYVQADIAKDSHVHWRDVLSKDRAGLGIIEEGSCHSRSSGDNGSRSDVASLTSDSGTDSMADMEPPSVPSRRQSGVPSVTTMHSLPPKEQGVYALVALEESYQGQSWIDLDVEDSSQEDDDDDDDDDNNNNNNNNVQRGEAQTSRPISLLSGTTTIASGRTSESAPANLVPLDQILARLKPASFSTERPHTSSGVSVLDNPRLSEIARSVRGQSHRRSLSHNSPGGKKPASLSELQPGTTHSWTSTANTLASAGSNFDHEILRSEVYPAPAARRAQRYQARMAARSRNNELASKPGSAFAEETDHATTAIIDIYAQPDQLQPQTKPVGETDTSLTNRMAANDRMGSVMDISAQAREETLPESKQQQSLNPLRMNPPDAVAQENNNQDHQPASPDESVESSDSGVVDETFFRSKISLPDGARAAAAAATSSARAAAVVTSAQTVPSTTAAKPGQPINMRLHPDVFSRLETSIAGFPDTMLGTKALPIEIIRSLPRRRHYRTPGGAAGHSPSSSLEMALEQPDYAPAPGQRWKVTGGSSLRKREQPGVTHSTVPVSQAPPPPPPPPPKYPSRPDELSSAAKQQPSPAGVIQRVFPAGSALHCDSLYAHLVAYLYVSSLCGPDAFYADAVVVAPRRGARVTAATPVPKGGGNSRTRSSLMHQPARMEDGAAGRAVHLKAEAVLGMSAGVAPGLPGAGLGGGGGAAAAAGQHRLSKMRSFFHPRQRARERAEEERQGRMVPAESPKVGGRNRPVTERELRDVQEGLLRCVRSLVGRLKGTDDVEEDGVAGEADGWKVLDPYLFRALCEIVKGEEERLGMV